MRAEIICENVLPDCKTGIVSEGLDYIISPGRRHIISANTPPGYITKIIDESQTKQIRSEAAGVFKSVIEIGKHTERGDLLGIITDPFEGETLSEIRSSVSGTVYFEYHDPLINANTVCFKIIQ